MRSVKAAKNDRSGFRQWSNPSIHAGINILRAIQQPPGLIENQQHLVLQIEFRDVIFRWVGPEIGYSRLGSMNQVEVELCLNGLSEDGVNGGAGYRHQHADDKAKQQHHTEPKIEWRKHLLSAQPISNAADCLDQFFRMFLIYFLPQAVNVDLNEIGFRGESIRPHVLDDLRTRKRVRRPQKQQLEQRKFF